MTIPVIIPPLGGLDAPMMAEGLQTSVRIDAFVRSFASDNNAPAATAILEALTRANEGDAVGYGRDPLTAAAIERFRAVFGATSDVYFTFNGTGANAVALASLLRPHEAVIAPATSHLHTDECGAFERFSGSKLLAVPTTDGKLHLADLEPFAHGGREEHHVVPRAISISQSTEFGGVYAPGELAELAAFAHRHGWFVHMDGARIANAAAALGLGLREATRDLGIDVLSFGGTKNGLLYGEALIFFDAALHHATAPFVRKQAMQLASKSRYIAAQFLALLQDDRWLTHAAHANAMAHRLAEHVRRIPGVRITRPVDANAVFATLDRALIAPLQERYFFYIFEETLPEVRWMTHHATTERDVDEFAAAIASAFH